MRPRGASALHLPSTILMAAMSVVFACTMAPVGGRPPISPTGPSTSQPPPTIGPTAPPTADPTPTTPPATATNAGPSAPPAARLSDGSSTVTGLLGTFCWLDTCSDTFEIPALASLPDLSLTAAGVELTLATADGSGFYRWAASYGPGTMDELMPLDDDGHSYDPDTTATVPPMFTEATFTGPPSGDWVVYVVLSAVEGEAHHMWHVIVP